jgi:hypothetical protein
MTARDHLTGQTAGKPGACGAFRYTTSLYHHMDNLGVFSETWEMGFSRFTYERFFGKWLERC